MVDSDVLRNGGVGEQSECEPFLAGIRGGATSRRKIFHSFRPYI